MNSFPNIEDVGSVRSISSWDLSPGFLKVFYGKMILTLVYNKHQLRYGLEYMARLRYWRQMNWTITILQDYCNFCESIDHYVEIWKTYKTNETEKQAKEKFEQRKLGKKAHKVFLQTRYDR